MQLVHMLHASSRVVVDYMGFLAVFLTVPSDARGGIPRMSHIVSLPWDSSASFSNKCLSSCCFSIVVFAILVLQF